MKNLLYILCISFLLLFSCSSEDDDTPQNLNPVVNGISSESGKIGDEIVINGQNFSKTKNQNIVKFNGVQAEINSASISQLKVVVPKNSTSGALTLSVNNGQIITIETFIVIDVVKKWRLNKMFVDNKERTLTECDKQSYMEFSSNSTFDRKTWFILNNDCIEEEIADSDKVYTSDLQNNKIVLKYNDVDEGPQTEILNILELTETKLIYSWDEDGNGTDEYKIEYLKYQ